MKRQIRYAIRRGMGHVLKIMKRDEELRRSRERKYLRFCQSFWFSFERGVVFNPQAIEHGNRLKWSKWYFKREKCVSLDAMRAKTANFNGF